jgi:hypothetical protein
LPLTAKIDQPLCDGIHTDAPYFYPNHFRYTAKYSVVSVIYMPPVSTGSQASTINYDSTAEVGTATTSSTIRSDTSDFQLSIGYSGGIVRPSGSASITAGSRDDITNGRTDAVSVTTYMNRGFVSQPTLVYEDIPHLQDIIVLQPYPVVDGYTYPEGMPPPPAGYKKTTWSYNLLQDPPTRIEVPVGCLITSVDPTTGRRIYNPQYPDATCRTLFFTGDGHGRLDGSVAAGNLGLTVDDLPNILKAHPLWNYFYCENGPDLSAETSTQCGKYWWGNTAHFDNQGFPSNYTIEPIPDRNRFLLLTDKISNQPLPWSATQGCVASQFAKKNSSYTTTTAQSSITDTSGFSFDFGMPFGLAGFKFAEVSSFTNFSSQVDTDSSTYGILATIGCPRTPPPLESSNVYVYLDKIYKTFYFSFSAPLGTAAPLLTPPSSVRAFAPNPLNVTLSWPPVHGPPGTVLGTAAAGAANVYPFTGASTYVVLYSASGADGPFQEVPGSSVTFDTGTLPATSATVRMPGASGFYYKVAAVGNDGRYYPQSTSAAVAPLGVPAAPPAPLLANGQGWAFSTPVIISIPQPRGGTWSSLGVQSFDILKANALAWNPDRAYDWQYISKNIPAAATGDTVFVDDMNEVGWASAYVVAANNEAGSSAYSPYSVIRIPPKPFTSGTFSQNFDGTTTTNQCSAFSAFIMRLAIWSQQTIFPLRAFGTVTMSGTYDSPGLACTDPDIATAIAIALENNVSYMSPVCDGHTWYVGSCGDGPEVSVDYGPCACGSPGYSIRPCIWDGSPDPGGVGTSTCQPPAQTMTLSFWPLEYSSGASLRWPPPPAVYEQTFAGPTQHDSRQCNAFRNLAAQLTAVYSQVTLAGTNDIAGVSCGDPAIVNAIAAALRSRTAYTSPSCLGHVWRVGNSGSVGDLEVSVDAPIGVCSSQGWSVRPCVGDGNPNWGGAGTRTCNGPPQTLILAFQ